MSRQQPFRGLPVALAVAAVAAVALGTLTAATAAPAGPPHHAPPRLHPIPNTQAAHAKTQAVLNEIVAQGTPGVIDKGHGGPQDRYGLGIRHFKLKEGCWAWGHGGMIPGSATRTLASADGRRVMTMNRNGDWGEQRLEDAAVETEFCERRQR
jgi:hypothetical protein